MVIAQCDAMISLLDSEYYERGWCSVEVMMVQTLRRSYGLHLWFEDVPAREDELSNIGLLRKADDREIIMKDVLLSYEEDRPKIMFLERQSKLLA
jgi:hypothetical protein